VVSLLILFPLFCTIAFGGIIIPVKYEGTTKENDRWKIAVVAMDTVLAIGDELNNIKREVTLVQWISGSLWSLVLALATALLGYFVGVARSFRDQKQKVYSQILPPIIQMGLDPSKADEQAFNRALARLWLYANRKAALKMERALSFLKPERASPQERVRAFQEAVVALRGDIQVFPYLWRRLRPEEVNHLYFRIVGQKP